MRDEDGFRLIGMSRNAPDAYIMPYISEKMSVKIRLHTIVYMPLRMHNEHFGHKKSFSLVLISNEQSCQVKQFSAGSIALGSLDDTA